MSEQMELDREAAVHVRSAARSDPLRRVDGSLEHLHAPPRAVRIPPELGRAMRLRYDSVAQSLHWMIASLIVVQLILGVLTAQLPHVKESILPVHKGVGVTILILAIVRLAWRLRHTPPPLPTAMNAFERFAAKGAHAALQGLTLLLPLTGLILISAPDSALRVVGLIAPALHGSQPAYVQLKSIHGVLAASLVVIVLLHAFAALRHHFWLRDDVLIRMLPRRSGGRIRR